MSSKLEALVSMPGISRKTAPIERRGDSPPAAPSLLLGEVVETLSTEFPGRAAVHWHSAARERNEQWLPVVKGLTLAKGDRVLMQRPGNSTEWLVTHALAAGEPHRSHMVEALVDGRRVAIEGRDEIVLRCGQASITLRRNGRLILRGAYVESRSKGTNRIKGGSVLIN